MHAFKPAVATILLTVTALTLAGTGSAVADTNKSQQDSAISGPTAPVLSPDASRPDNAQHSRQNTDKAHTTNWSVIDYAGNKKPPRKLRKKNKEVLLGLVVPELVAKKAWKARA
ncbi:hypothetical protein [Streptomyces flavidovirens]